MDLDQLWKNTQEELRVVLAPAVYQTFVAKTQLISLQNSEAIIACSNAYLCDLNQKRYYELFKSAFDNQTKKDNRLKFIVRKLLKMKMAMVWLLLLFFPISPKAPPPILHRPVSIQTTLSKILSSAIAIISPMLPPKE